MCEYDLEDGHKCPLQRYGNSPFCILHLDFPENKKSIEYSQVIELKNNAIREKIQTGDYNFYGVIIHEFTFPEESIINTSINFNKTKIEGDVSLGRGLTIQGHAFFKGSKIKGNAWFGGSSFKGDIRFDGAQIGGDALFSGISTKGDIWFNDAIINGYALFLGALIEGNASFERATIEGDACFDGATIKGDACFDGATIKGDARFCHDKVAGGIIQGDISLIDTKILRKLKFSNSFFTKQQAKEQINRLAKRLCEARGEKFDAGKYFFRKWLHGESKKVD